MRHALMFDREAPVYTLPQLVLDEPVTD